MDILQKFMSLQDGKTLIFPRYHQLDVVHKLVADVRQKGAWQHYLIQHSAGSGKSNSIALDVDAPSTRNVSVRKCCPPESCTVCKGHRQQSGLCPCQCAKVRQERGQQGSAKSQAHHTEWLKTINAQSTSLNTVAKYYAAKYNNTEEYQLLSKYSYSVQHGNISPLAGFDNYISGYHRIEAELVGQKSINGLEVTGQSMHFMERVLGTIKDPKTERPRDGVEVSDVISCVLNGTTRGIKYDAAGRPSLLFFSDKCAVSINPDTGELIQCNPFFR